MKKIFVVFGFLLLGTTAVHAQKYMTRTGKIIFDATTPASPEKILGTNNEVACILDSKTGEVVFQVMVKSFKFKSQLMEEHFNENYMETDKFPKSDFKEGKITNIEAINFGADGTYNATVTGKLTIHGVTNTVTEPGTITVAGGNIKLAAKFSVKLKDYKITVPSLVEEKVAKDALISLQAELSKK